MFFIPIKKILSFSLIALMVLLLSCKGDKKETHTVASADIQAREDKIQSVVVVNPSLESFNAEILITGTAMPNQKVMLHSMESGFVKSIRKDIGNYVKKGDIIAVLENPNIFEMLAEAKANLQIGQAELLSYRAELEAANADANAQKILSDRLNSIYQKTPQLITIVEKERASAEMLKTKAIVSAKAARISAQQEQLKALQSKINLAEARNNMLYIKAPFTGIVTQRNIDKGALVQSGMSGNTGVGIVEIQDVNPIRLTLPVPASDASSIKKGMMVSVSFPELAGQAFDAKISRTSHVLDASSKSMQVEIDIDNKDGKILSGMYAKAKINMNSRDNVLSLPVTAQIMYQDKPFILVVNDDKVQRIPLRKGLSGKDYFEVLNAEINKQTKVITTGKNLVRVGQIVLPIRK